MLRDINPDQIQDLEGARQAVKIVLNLVEELKAENERLRDENQKLHDEINRLKGEQGKPDIKASKKERQEHSSEKERRQPKKWKKSGKLDKIRIDVEKVVKIERSNLPADAEFKGHVPVVVQDLRIESHNIRFLKEKYYSANEGKIYLAELPAGYEGEFGPTIRSLSTRAKVFR